ncbi:MAG TPA: hypothetical protein VJB91_00760, partial [Patescibacteria group bacterium]|nr:hypothetical protein [Patescibacteria group bacterium]
MKNKFKWRDTFLFFFFGACIILVIYGSIIQSYFIGEDYAWWQYVRGRSFIEVLRYFLYPPSEKLAGFYHPLVGLSYWLNVNTTWMNPVGFHLTSFLLHFGSFLLVVAIGKVLLGNRTTSFLSGLFFLVFPFHAEAVAWIDGRHDLLAAFFGLTSFYLFLRWFENRQRWQIACSCLFLFLALSSKEMAITFPLVFSFYTWWIGKGTVFLRSKNAFQLTKGYYAILLVYFFLRIRYVGEVNPLSAASHLMLTVPRPTILYMVFLFSSFVFFFSLKKHVKKDLWRSFSLLPLFAVVIGLLYLPTAFLFTEIRYLYLPSTMASIFLANFVDLLWRMKHAYSKGIRIVLMIGVLGIWILSGYYLIGKVYDWKTASEIARRTTVEFKKYSEDIPESATVYFLNLPDNYKGSYIFRTHAVEAFRYGTGRDFQRLYILPTTLGLQESSARFSKKNEIEVVSKDGFLLFPPLITRELSGGIKVMETGTYT